jgi:hypothetical protein
LPLLKFQPSYKYNSYDYRVIFFMSKCVYIFLGHSIYLWKLSPSVSKISARPATDAVKVLNCFVSWHSNSICLPRPRPTDQQIHNNSILLIITVEFINYHCWLFSEQVTRQVCELDNTILPLLVCGCETWSLTLKNIGRGCLRKGRSERHLGLTRQK